MPNAAVRGALALALLLTGATTASAAPAARVKGAKAQPAAQKQKRLSTAKAREIVRFRQGLRRRLAEHAPVWEGLPLFHQVKDATNKAKWAGELNKATTATARSQVLQRWLGAGRYPGIWTLDESEGWYGKSGGAPFAIQLKRGVTLFDPDNKEHQAIYAAWKQEHPLGKGGAKNLFDEIHDADGTPLSRKTGYIHAPSQAQFYRDLGIAGVAHYDTYGRRCVVLFNPHAIADVRIAE